MLDRLHAIANSMGYEGEHTSNRLRLQWPNSPITMLLEAPEQGSPPAVFWLCRNSSAHFLGDRSDINFACTILFASWMSSFLQTTFELQEVGHPFLSDENDGYLVIPRQPQYLGVSILASPFDSLVLALKIQHGFEHNLVDLLGYQTDRGAAHAGPNEWPAAELDAAAAPRSGLQGVTSSRDNPTWRFYHRPDTGLVVLQSSTLFRSLAAFTRLTADSEQLTLPIGRLRRDANGKHLVRRSLLQRAERIARALGQPAWTCEPPLVLLENALCLISQDLVMLLPGACGRAAHESAVSELATRHTTEAAFLKGDVSFTWASPVPPDRFEALVHQLLQLETGVIWCRPVGGAYDRDEGRDLIADWNCSVRRDGEGLAVRRVVIQCKVRQKGVGKADVTDIRDTLDSHDASGLVIVTPTRLTSGLVNHLDQLREQERYWVDWWTQSELELRLRRHPDVLERFTDVVVEAKQEEAAGA